MSAVARALVPIDVSPSARAALEHATFLAVGFGSELVALHVRRPARWAGPDALAFIQAGEGRPWEETRGEVLREVKALTRPERRDRPERSSP